MLVMHLMKYGNLLEIRLKMNQKLILQLKSPCKFNLKSTVPHSDLARKSREGQ